jgi:hypothetical protein
LRRDRQNGVALTWPLSQGFPRKHVPRRCFKRKVSNAGLFALFSLFDLAVRLVLWKTNKDFGEERSQVSLAISLNMNRVTNEHV